MMSLAANVGLTLMLLLAASCARQRDSQPSVAQPRGDYATPEAVFDAYREAKRKREWRTCFDCLTPDAQNNLMFELVFSCGMAVSERAPLIVKEYVADTLQSDLEKQFKEKFGMDHATFREKLRSDPKVAAMQASEEQFVRDMMAAHVRDKAGFFEAVNNLLGEGERYEPFGELEQLVVEGETASGQAETMSQHWSNEGNGDQKIVRSRYDYTFHFRKLNGGWLIEQFF